MSVRLIARAFLAFAMLAGGHAGAETRAWLDRDRIVLGESATLNIETDQAVVDAPEYGVLRGDFRLSGHASRRSLERGSGGTVRRSLFAVALAPTREGVIGIPARQVGKERTQPLTLTVLPDHLGTGEEPWLVIRCVYVGEDAGRGTELLERLRRTAPPDEHTIGPISWPHWQSAGDDLFPADARGFWRNAAFSRMDEDALDTILSKPKRDIRKASPSPSGWPCSCRSGRHDAPS